MKKLTKIIISIILLGAGIWFALPVFRNAYALGSFFGQMVCLLGLFIIWFYKKINDKGGWKSKAVKTLTVLYIVGILWCSYLTVLMNSYHNSTPAENTNIILLGAKVEKNGKPSLSLRDRIEVAYNYLVENPKAVCIVTGGKGFNEPISEAQCEKDYLLEKGIEEDRIFVEDNSSNTRQNFEFALEIAKDNSLGNEFAVITQDFHMYRSMQLAKSMGITTYAVAAESDPLIYPTYYGRELLSLTKWYIEKIFI